MCTGKMNFTKNSANTFTLCTKRMVKLILGRIVRRITSAKRNVVTKAVQRRQIVRPENIAKNLLLDVSRFLLV